MVFGPEHDFLLNSALTYCGQFCWPNQPILIMCESASCQYHNSPMIDLFLLSGNTTTNNADNGSLQSSSNSKTKMAGGNTVIATGSGTISVTASQQLHTVAKISSNITLGKKIRNYTTFHCTKGLTRKLYKDLEVHIGTFLEL